MKIYPTHTCFDDAIEILCEIIKQDPGIIETTEFELVHAIVSPAGKELAHAWIERNREICFWVGIVEGNQIVFASKRDDYRQQFNVVEEKRYTIREMWEENARHNNFGPWIEKYRALCGSDNGLAGEMELKAMRVGP